MNSVKAPCTVYAVTDMGERLHLQQHNFPHTYDTECPHWSFTPDHLGSDSLVCVNNRTRTVQRLRGFHHRRSHAALYRHLGRGPVGHSHARDDDGARGADPGARYEELWDREPAGGHHGCERVSR